MILKGHGAALIVCALVEKVVACLVMNVPYLKLKLRVDFRSADGKIILDNLVRKDSLCAFPAVDSWWLTSGSRTRQHVAYGFRTARRLGCSENHTVIFWFRADLDIAVSRAK